MDQLSKNKAIKIENNIRKAFKSDLAGMNVHVIGIIAEDEADKRASDAIIQSPKQHFTAVIKKEETIYSVKIEEDDSVEDILQRFYHELTN